MSVENQYRIRLGTLLLLWSLLSSGENFAERGLADRIIQTIAGTGVPGFSGDGGPAVAAQLNSPATVVPGPAGLLYIADVRNHRIRRVDAQGIISTVAGTGRPGFGGDGGPAIEAQLNQPLGLTVDAQGNLYIADTLNHRIRKVDVEGRITTAAGNGREGYSGDGGPALEASLSRPVGLTLDAEGNLYIADVFNHRIRKVDTQGRISTVAGNGEAGFGGDGGPAVQASLFRPRDVAVDETGNLYIADTDNNRIRRVGGDGIITTIAGTGDMGFSGDGGPATEARLNLPRSVAVDSTGCLFISDMGNLRIRQVNREGIIITVVGNGEFGFSGDGGPATQARLGLPRGVRLDSSGAIYIADLDNHRVRVVR